MTPVCPLLGARVVLQPNASRPSATRCLLTAVASPSARTSSISSCSQSTRLPSLSPTCCQRCGCHDRHGAKQALSWPTCPDGTNNWFLKVFQDLASQLPPASLPPHSQRTARHHCP